MSSLPKGDSQKVQETHSKSIALKTGFFRKLHSHGILETILNLINDWQFPLSRKNDWKNDLRCNSPCTSFCIQNDFIFCFVSRLSSLRDLTVIVNLFAHIFLLYFAADFLFGAWRKVRWLWGDFCGRVWSVICWIIRY